MPNYTFNTIDRGPEPQIRNREQITDANNRYTYVLTQDDIMRNTGFVLETVAQRLFGDCDLAWIISDVNDEIKDAEEYAVGGKISIPLNWEEIARSGIQNYSTARIRGV